MVGTEREMRREIEVVVRLLTRTEAQESMTSKNVGARGIWRLFTKDPSSIFWPKLPGVVTDHLLLYMHGRVCIEVLLFESWLSETSYSSDDVSCTLSLTVRWYIIV